MKKYSFDEINSYINELHLFKYLFLDDEVGGKNNQLLNENLKIMFQHPYDLVDYESFHLVDKSLFNFDNKTNKMKLIDYINNVPNLDVNKLDNFLNNLNLKNSAKYKQVGSIGIGNKIYYIKLDFLKIQHRELFYIKNADLNYESIQIYHSGNITNIKCFPHYNYAPIHLMVESDLREWVNKLQKSKKNKLIIKNKENLKIVFQLNKDGVLT